MLRSLTRIGMLVIAVAAPAVPASAQTVQSVQFNFGGFTPRGADSRSLNDLLLNNTDFLAFSIKDFKHPVINGEWSVAFGNRVEAGVGVGFYNRHVDTNYRDLVNQDGSELIQTLGLRVVPVTAVVRFMPVGKTGHLQPYIGGGVGFSVWRYSESGQFVDANYNVFRARYASNGTTTAPLFLFGLKAPLSGDIYALTMEGRYQWSALGNLDPTQGFSGSKIDLSGFTYTFGLQIRF